VQVTGEVLVTHEIEVESDDETVQVEAVERSISGGGGDGLVACAMKVWVTSPVLALGASHVTTVVEQEVGVLIVPSHTSKLLMLPSYDVAVAVALRPCAAAVIVAVPLPTPCTVALPQGCALAQAPTISTIPEGLLVQETPLVIGALGWVSYVPHACIV